MKKLILGVVALACAPVFAQTMVNVSPLDMKGWAFYDDSTKMPCAVPANCAIVNGPATPPIGAGSARLALVAGSEHPVLAARLDALAGTRFADLTSLSYSTYVTTHQNVQAIALQFDADNDVTDEDYNFKGRLVFEPYHEPSLGAVTPGQWQTWDTLAGKWWLSGAGHPARFPSPVCSQNAPCTVAQLLGHYPNIGIRDVPAQPNTVFKAGSNWTNFDGNVDALTVGVDGVDTTYNFDVGPTSKDECKDGGWVGYFKNQGQCVSSFAKKK